MKKLFLLLFISLISFETFAQDMFSIGVKAGYTSTKFNLENYDQRLLKLNQHSGSGYLAGIYSRVRLYRGLSVQPEFYYAKKNGDVSFSGVNNDIQIPDSSYVTNVNSLELPLLLHLKLLDFDVANIYIVGGPVVAFNLNGTTEPEVDSGIENSNWTFLVGGGVEFWRMTVDARYEWSLSNVTNLDLPILKGAGEFYNMLTVSVGFKLFGM